MHLLYYPHNIRLICAQNKYAYIMNIVYAYYGKIGTQSQLVGIWAGGSPLPSVAYHLFALLFGRGSPSPSMCHQYYQNHHPCREKKSIGTKFFCFAWMHSPPDFSNQKKIKTDSIFLYIVTHSGKFDGNRREYYPQRPFGIRPA